MGLPCLVLAAEPSQDLMSEAAKFGFIGLLLVWFIWRDKARQERSDARWDETNAKLLDASVRASAAQEAQAKALSGLQGALDRNTVIIQRCHERTEAVAK